MAEHKKIIFLAPFGIRPKGTLIARMLPLAAALQRNGNEVVIIAPPYTNREDSGKIEFVSGVKIVNIKLPDLSKALSTPFISYRMCRATIAEQPDIVHLFKPKGYGGFAAMLLHLIHNKIPLFVDTDDFEGYGGMNDSLNYSGVEKMVYAWQEKTLLKIANRVTAASRALYEMVSQLRCKDDFVTYLPNCVDMKPKGEQRAVREKLSISDDHPLLLLYTRFFEFDQTLLHKLIVEIMQKAPDTTLLVAGKGRGDEMESLLNFAQLNGFRDKIAPFGWVEPELLPDIFAAADVAIYPLRNDLVNRTKCPAKLAELLSAGIAVVADRVGEAAEYIVDGESGLLCSSGDYEEMATKTVSLLNSREYREKIGGCAAKRMLEQFNWDEAAKRLLELY